MIMMKRKRMMRALLAAFVIGFSGQVQAGVGVVASHRLEASILLRLEGLPAGGYGLKIDSQLQPLPVISSGAAVTASVPVNCTPTTQVWLRLTSRSL